MFRKSKIIYRKKFAGRIKIFSKKKYSFEVKILSEERFVIPEYKINLLNKSKKLINTIENINSIIEVKKAKVNSIKGKKED